jgi:peptidoglycan/LPS O-acetylase OafA/YrhL
MGKLRFLLALSVLVAHSNPLFQIPFLPSNIAVEAFFIISGFYMAMIITEKYSKAKDSYKLFITNRLLRIYPLYWCVLIVSICFSVLLVTRTKATDSLTNYIIYWHSFKPGTLSYLILTNLLIVGQDIVCFLQTNVLGQLQFTSHFLDATPTLFTFEFIPQAWTLSLELMFYFMAPLFIRLKNIPLVIIIMALSIVRIIAWCNGLSYDPWLYRFFPFQLIWFLSGIISYRMYKRLSFEAIDIKIKYFIYYLVLVLTLFLSTFGYNAGLGLAYLIIIVFAIPFIFLITKTSKADRWIGEFSYPFYISHILLISLGHLIIYKFHLPSQLLSALAFVLTFLFSYLLIELVSKRIENIRAKRIREEVR